MACCDDITMAKLKKRVPELASMISLTGIMAVSGILVVLWMAVMGFADITGIIVGIIFIVLSVCQILFGIVWWRAVNNQSQQYDVVGEEELKAETQLNTNSSHSRLDGSGDANELVTDEVKLAHADSAQKAEVTMVKV